MSKNSQLLPALVVLMAACCVSTPGFAAADAACQPIFDAATKIFAVPTHSYTAETLPGGKSRNGETIYANNAIYILYNGKWIRGKATPQDMIKQEQENIQNAKTSCRHVRDGLVNGEVAALYAAHAENDGVKSDAQTWISKSRGLPLKTEEDIDTGDGDKRHMSIRYDYSNVRPPAACSDCSKGQFESLKKTEGSFVCKHGKQRCHFCSQS
jgi:hypothetical protein